MVLGLILLINYLLRHFIPYGIIDDFEITKGVLTKTTIALNDVTNVKIFAGDIKIYSDTKIIVFDKNQIDKTVLPEFEEFISSRIHK